MRSKAGVCKDSQTLCEEAALRDVKRGFILLRNYLFMRKATASAEINHYANEILGASGGSSEDDRG
ncbi:MAG: hypothetical protein ACLTDC_05745 [Lachnospiraceae bacterium]